MSEPAVHKVFPINAEALAQRKTNLVRGKQPSAGSTRQLPMPPSMATSASRPLPMPPSAQGSSGCINSGQQEKKTQPTATLSSSEPQMPTKPAKPTKPLIPMKPASESFQTKNLEHGDPTISLNGIPESKVSPHRVADSPRTAEVDTKSNTALAASNTVDLTHEEANKPAIPHKPPAKGLVKPQQMVKENSTTTATAPAAITDSPTKPARREVPRINLAQQIPKSPSRDELLSSPDHDMASPKSVEDVKSSSNSKLSPKKKTKSYRLVRNKSQAEINKPGNEKIPSQLGRKHDEAPQEETEIIPTPFTPPTPTSPEVDASSANNSKKSKLSRPEKKKSKPSKASNAANSVKGGTLRVTSRLFGKTESTKHLPETGEVNTNSNSNNSSGESATPPATPPLAKMAPNQRQSLLAGELKARMASSSAGMEIQREQMEAEKATANANLNQTFVKVESSFNKSRVARVEFRPEGTFKTINVTPRTTPVEAFQELMNKISKGLPPEHRDTLVAKYANHTLYRQFEDGEIQVILSDEPFLSPMQIVGSKEMPKFLFTDQKIEGLTSSLATGTKQEKKAAAETIKTVNLGELLQETHIKESQKADNAIDELVITERKFLFDTDLMMEMVLKPLILEDIISSKLVKKIFLNIEQINAFHRELYRRFQLDNSTAAIAAAFDNTILAHIEKVYTTYLGNYENSLSVFYHTRDHSEKFKRFLAKLANESPVFKDKSLNNLLVTPMQRVCKYELLLKNVISQESKRPEPDRAGMEALQLRIDKLSDTLQRIDAKRVESDNWETILRLEETLNLSEPLRKRGRAIVLEGSFNTSRRLFTGGVVNKHCTVILFNDILLRAYKSNKTGNFKVLDITNLDQLVIIDPYQVYSQPNTITLSSIDPRGGILQLQLASSEERSEWYQNLVSRTASMTRVCTEWGIAYTPAFLILSVDDCSWSEAYIERCRMFVTSTCVCLLWELFGSTFREKIPLSSISDVESFPKDNSERLKTTLWTGFYTLKKLNNFNTTSTVLRSVWQAARRDSKMPQDTTALFNEVLPNISISSLFSISPEEWSFIWKNGVSLDKSAGQEILAKGAKNYELFITLSGTVSVSSGNAHTIQLRQGELFGISSFLSGLPSTVRIQAGGEGASIMSKSIESILGDLKDNPSLQAKFFATLANSLATQV